MAKRGRPPKVPVSDPAPVMDDPTVIPAAPKTAPDPVPEPAKEAPAVTASEAVREGRDVVEMVDAIQGAISVSLVFSDSDKAFHERTVEVVAKRYNVRPAEWLIVARVVASGVKVIGGWTRAAFARWGKKPPAESAGTKGDPCLPSVT